MEKCQTALPSQAPSLFTISPSSPPPSLHATHRAGPSSSFDQGKSGSLHAHILSSSSCPNQKNARSAQDLSFYFTALSHTAFPESASAPCSIDCASSHSKLPPSHPITLVSTTSPARPCSKSDIARDRHCDDACSVASKLQSLITKSIDSPSLQLSSCKEAARETPYQKTLKLKKMKLHYCSEALGMESSDNSSVFYGSQCMQEKQIGIKGNASTSPPSFTLSNSHQESSLKSVKSSPNLTSSVSPLITNHSRYTRRASFPPPLSHTLPASFSSDSLSPALRAYREGGRFILKETMVPSKHYFHANRSNGRLTLHFVTREEEEEEEEHFARRHDNEEFSYTECQREKLSELEGAGCVKKSIGLQTSEETHAAASKEDMSSHRLNSITMDDRNNEYSEDDNKRNIISNVFTLSLQASTHSMVTLHKAQILGYPLLSSSLKPSLFIHSAEGTQGFLSSNHVISTFSESKENIILGGNLMPCAVAASGSECIKREGGGGVAMAEPAFVMKEVRAKSLVKVVTELATSLLVEGSCESGDWCLAGEKQPLLGEGESGESSTVIGGYAGAIDGAIIGNDGQIDDGANVGCFYEEEKTNITTSPLHPALHVVSSCNATLQNEEWLHTLHCKELFDRHHLSHGFIKLHCIPARS